MIAAENSIYLSAIKYKVQTVLNTGSLSKPGPTKLPHYTNPNPIPISNLIPNPNPYSILTHNS